MRLLFFFLLIGLTSLSQKDTIKVDFDNTVSGALFTNDNRFQASSRIISQNTIEHKKLILSSNTNYQINYQEKINGNELLQKSNLNIGGLFISHVFSYSLVREIQTDNSFGFGYSYKRKFKKLSYGISYAIVGQKTRFFDGQTIDVLRHSLRLKMKYENNFFGFSYEFYLQPSIQTIKDQIIYGTIKLALLPKSKFSLVVQDNINYNSLNEITTIHTVTFGIGHTILYNKQLKRKNDKL